VRRRLLATYVSLTLLVEGMLGVPLAITFRHDLQHDRTLEVQSGTSTLATLVDDSREHSTSVTVPTLATRYATELKARIVVLDGRYRTLAMAGGPGTIAPFLDAVGHAPPDRATSGSAAGWLYVIAPVSGGGHVLSLYRPIGINGAVRRYWLLIGLLGALALAAATAIGLYLARSISRPLEVLERATAAAGEGHLATHVDESGPPEVRSLARSFNEATTKLDRVLAAQAAWVSDASHQLRTPLSALQLRLENLQSNQRLAPDRAEIAAALAEVQRLAHLTDGLLALGRLDAAKPSTGTVDIRAVINARVLLWSALGDEHQVTITADVEGSPVAACEKARLEQVLDNLLANALEASPPNTTITIRGHQTNDTVELHVVDEGPGLSTDERNRAFDRFWRGRTQEDGSGLGLAIVRELVHADYGQVALEEAPSGGIDAVVWLPGPAVPPHKPTPVAPPTPA
jgi:signal transduction histidine kinase